METINILTIVDSLDDFLLVNVFGKGKLHDEAVDIIIFVQFINTSQEFLLGDIVLIADEGRFETAGLASQHLVLHIGLRTTIMTYQYSSQMGLFATILNNLFHFLGNLGLNRRCRCFSVN